MPDSGGSFGWVLDFTEISKKAEDFLSSDSATIGSWLRWMDFVNVPQRVGSKLRRGPAERAVFSVENGEF